MYMVSVSSLRRVAGHLSRDRDITPIWYNAGRRTPIHGDAQDDRYVFLVRRQCSGKIRLFFKLFWVEMPLLLQFEFHSCSTHPYHNISTTPQCANQHRPRTARFLNGGSRYPQIIWQWKKLPHLQSSVGWLRRTTFLSVGGNFGKRRSLWKQGIEMSVKKEDDDIRQRGCQTNKKWTFGNDSMTLRIHAASSWSKQLEWKRTSNLKVSKSKSEQIKELMKVLPKVKLLEVLYQELSDKKEEEKKKVDQKINSIEKDLTKSWKT